MGSRSVSIFSVLALMVFSCEATFQNLQSINDLRTIDFGNSVPKHSLLLLHWFANVINIDRCSTMTLTFNPDIEDFGSHHYGNYEAMLDQVPRGYRYFTVGNLYEDTSHELPEYVLHPPLREYEGNNRGRIVFRVQETNPGVNRIDQVYLTQHYREEDHQGTRYNPDHTYRISPNLLLQMRMFSVLNNPRSLTQLRDEFHSNADDIQLRSFRNTWGEELACLGLLLFIVIQTNIRQPQEEEGCSTTQAQYEADRSELECIIQNEHSHHSAQDETRVPTVMDHTDHEAGVYKATETTEDATFNDFDLSIQPSSSASSGPQSEQECPDFADHAHVLQLSGGDPEALPGHLPRETTKRHPEQIPEPPERTPFNLPNNYLEDNKLTEFVNTVAPLVLCVAVYLLLLCFAVCLLLLFFAACLHLSVLIQLENTGRGTELPGRVAIEGYSAHLELVENQHKACARVYIKELFSDWRYQFRQSWVGFYKSVDKDTNEYEWGQWQWVTKFQPCSGSVEYNGNCFEYCSDMEAAAGVQARFILAQYRQIARTPSLHSPNGVKITGYNVHLELTEADNKACARLYVTKSYTQWTSELADSWVGFYTSPERGTDQYESWQWATKFKQYDSYWDFNVFEYCSNIKATPGINARFTLGSTERARTHDLHLP